MSSPSLLFKAVLFDLDGTLLDTAGDLTAALNHVCDLHGQPSVSLEQTRPVASDGFEGLAQVGLGWSREHPDYSQGREAFIRHYQDHIAVHTQLFEGVDDILLFLKQHQLPWGIITNKMTDSTHKLLQRIQWPYEPHVVVCGDTLSVAKPHPEPLWHAAESIGIAPEDCCYVGDHERDIVAAQRAKMFPVFAEYGYVNQPPRHAYGALARLTHPRELISVIQTGVSR